MSTSKYIIYKCDVCSRQTELELDGNRPDPLRCNITENCRGKFSRVGGRSVREFLFTPIVPGLSDYIPRGTVINPAPQLVVPNPITVFTASGTGIIALSGVQRSSTSTPIVGYPAGHTEFSIKKDDIPGTKIVIENAPIATINPQTSSIRAVLFEISSELLTSSKYTYVIAGPASIVSGQDNSPESKNLRFTEANKIVVYANGIELIYEDTPSGRKDYDRRVDNQITFTPTIYDSNNVIEVFVYKDISVAIGNSKQVVLEFNSLVPTIVDSAALRELDCWGNYSSVKINSIERFTLFCTDLSQLNINKSYGLAYFEVTSIDSTIHRVKSSEVFILLGKEPFAFRDKELYAYLSGTSLVDLQSILTYKQSAASGELLLSVDETSITQVFNPLILTNPIETLNSITTVSTSLPGSENLNQKYILGPV